MPETTTQYEEIVDVTAKALYEHGIGDVPEQPAWEHLTVDGDTELVGNTQEEYRSMARAVLDKLRSDHEKVLYLLSHSLDERGREELRQRIIRDGLYGLTNSHLEAAKWNGATGGEWDPIAEAMLHALLPPTEAGQ